MWKQQNKQMISFMYEKMNKYIVNGENKGI